MPFMFGCKVEDLYTKVYTDRNGNPLIINGHISFQWKSESLYYWEYLQP